MSIAKIKAKNRRAHLVIVASCGVRLKMCSPRHSAARALTTRDSLRGTVLVSVRFDMRISLLIFGLLLFGCDIEQKDNIRLVSRTPAPTKQTPPVSATAAADVVSEPKQLSDREGVVPPTPMKRVEPILPELAPADIGFVALEAFVSLKGDVTHVKIIRGGGNVYTQAVAAALREWKFRPGTVHGKPTEMTYQLTAHIDVH